MGQTKNGSWSVLHGKIKPGGFENGDRFNTADFNVSNDYLQIAEWYMRSKNFSRRVARARKFKKLIWHFIALEMRNLLT